MEVDFPDYARQLRFDNMALMIKALEQAIEKVRKLPRERQEYAAEVLEQIAEAGDEVYVLTDEERRLVREGLAELDRGEAATEEEVRAVFDKYRV